MKTITSNVPEFPGTIELPDFFTLPQVIKYSDILDSVKEEKNWSRAFKLLPVQLELTGNWHIQGLAEKPDPNTFPFSPAPPAAALLSWLNLEIIKMVVGERELPNDLRPRSTDTAKIPATTDGQTN